MVTKSKKIYAKAKVLSVSIIELAKPIYNQKRFETSRYFFMSDPSLITYFFIWQWLESRNALFIPESTFWIEQFPIHFESIIQSRAAEDHDQAQRDLWLFNGQFRQFGRKANSDVVDVTTQPRQYSHIKIPRTVVKETDENVHFPLFIVQTADLKCTK